MVSVARVLAGLALAIGIVSGPALAEDYRLLEIDRKLVKWGAPRLGEPAAISYEFVRTVQAFPQARNCREIRPLRLHSTRSPIPFENVVREFEKAAAAWSKIADVHFFRAKPGHKPDLLIGAQVLPRGRAYANVTPHNSPSAEPALREAGEPPASEIDELPERNAQIRSIRHSLICLNPTQSWKIGFDGNLDVYDLRYTFLHELGHVIGLNHVLSRQSVMGFRYQETHSRPQAADIAGAVRLYGNR